MGGAVIKLTDLLFIFSGSIPSRIERDYRHEMVNGPVVIVKPTNKVTFFFVLLFFSFYYKINMSFYITLPSNSSADLFPDNKISNFRTKLGKNVRLPHQNFEVAVVEASYVYNIQQFPAVANENWIIVKDIVEIRWTKLYLKKNTFLRIDELVNHVSELLNGFYKNQSDFSIHFDAYAKRIEISITEGRYSLTLSNQLSAILGYPPNFRFEAQNEPYVGEYSPDLRAGLYRGFLYSNIVEMQLVGDIEAPLLRTFELGGNWGEERNLIFTQPYYIKLNTSELDIIHLYVLSEVGDPIIFNAGILTITLHFREIK